MIFQSLWKPFKSPLSLQKQKRFGEVSLSLICITSNLTTIYSLKRFMEDLAVITALNNWGSFGENFVMFKEKR